MTVTPTDQTGGTASSRLEDGSYTAGFCHAFAEAAHHISGLPIRAIRKKMGRSMHTLHVFLELPNGHFLDACGIHARETLWTNYAGSGECEDCFEERWDIRDLRMAVRRGDLQRLSHEDKDIALSDARTVLESQHASLKQAGIDVAAITTSDMQIESGRGTS